MTRGLHLAAWAVLTLGLPAPHIATADPAIGVGLNIVFGGGRIDTGVGIRIFSSDRPNSAAGSIGVDYLLREQEWRATLGAAYLFDDGYLEVNSGLQLNGDGPDLGLGGGWAGNLEASSTSPAPASLSLNTTDR